MALERQMIRAHLVYRVLFKPERSTCHRSRRSRNKRDMAEPILVSGIDQVREITDCVGREIICHHGVEMDSFGIAKFKAKFALTRA